MRKNLTRYSRIPFPIQIRFSYYKSITLSSKSRWWGFHNFCVFFGGVWESDSRNIFSEKKLGIDRQSSGEIEGFVRHVIFLVFKRRRVTPNAGFLFFFRILLIFSNRFLFFSFHIYSHVAVVITHILYLLAISAFLHLTSCRSFSLLFTSIVTVRPTISPLDRYKCGL